MKVYIDCQILQTGAYDRGMGKYCVSLLGALSETNFFTKNTVILIYNKNLPNFDRVHLISKYFKDTLLIGADLPTNIAVDYDTKIKKARFELDKITKSKGKIEKKYYIILCPFFVDFFSVFPSSECIVKSSLVFDLIPYILRDKVQIFPDDLYFKHFNVFDDANFLFCISNSVRSDIVSMLGVPDKKAININGGPFDTKKYKNFNYPDYPYILFPSAPIYHKNNINIIKGFEIFNKKIGNKYKIIITSTFDEITKMNLKKISENIIFTGNVSDKYLKSLYEGAKGIIFGSLIEGLGMPILESVACSKPVACSNIDVFSEMSKNAFYEFDPYSIYSIAHALLDMVNGKEWQRKNSYYGNIIKKYSWHHSADKVVDTLSTIEPKVRKMKYNIIIKIGPAVLRNYGIKFIEENFFSLSNNFKIILELPQKNEKISYLKYMPNTFSSEKLADYVININTEKIINNNPSIPGIDIVFNKLIRNRKAINLKTYEYTKYKKEGFRAFNFSHKGSILTSQAFVNLINDDINKHNGNNHPEHRLKII